MEQVYLFECESITEKLVRIHRQDQKEKFTDEEIGKQYITIFRLIRDNPPIFANSGITLTMFTGGKLEFMTESCDWEVGKKYEIYIQPKQ